MASSWTGRWRCALSALVVRSSQLVCGHNLAPNYSFENNGSSKVCCRGHGLVLRRRLWWWDLNSGGRGERRLACLGLGFFELAATATHSCTAGETLVDASNDYRSQQSDCWVLA